MSDPTTPRPLEWLKPAVTTGAMVPIALLLIRGAKGQLQSDWVAEILNQFGMLALIFLVASLACTPLKLVTGWTWPLRIRKLTGLLAFFYAMLHVAWYAVPDKNLDLGVMWEDVWERPFITFGFAAFVLLIPLAATSTKGAIRKLGAQRWQRLHRLAYAAGILAAIHFIYRVKLDLTEPLIYTGVLAVLLMVRIVNAVMKRRSTPDAGDTTAAPSDAR